MKENILMLISLFIVLSNIYILGTSRLGGIIKGVAWQGIFLSVLPLLIIEMNDPHLIIHVCILSSLSILIKGYIIPNYLNQIIKEVKVKRELNPFVGYFSSILFGLIVSYGSYFMTNKLPFFEFVVYQIHASTAMASILIGVFLIVSRKNVLAQIIGFLVFENAGFILGISVASSQPLFIELGILFDLVVGVVILGAALKLINFHFNTLDVNSLERLQY